VQVSGERDFFASMVVDAVTRLDPDALDLRMLGIKKVQVRRPCRHLCCEPLLGGRP
jgi:hypothetical protein